QTWTTLRTLQTSSQNYKNIFTPDSNTPNLVSIHTVPKVGIGQRAFLCRTPAGNVLWDCLTYIDDETVTRINELGGLKAVVISHPHYYSTNLHWARAFGCPVYLSCEDEEWAVRRDGDIAGGTGDGDGDGSGSGAGKQVFWEGKEMLPLKTAGSGSAATPEEGDLVVIKTGGHFPGSSVLWWKSLRKLLIADSILVVPSGIYHVDRPVGTASFTFMWSYPNMIPLPPDEVHNIWKAIKDTEFDDAHAAFVGLDTRGNSKKRMLESAKIFVGSMGYLDHAIHQEA
ncbi:metallo-beta-lactamase, partial [Aspergillus sclerotialis]